MPALDKEPKPLSEDPVPALDFSVGFVSSQRAFAARGISERNQTDAFLQAATEKTRELPGLRSFFSRGSIFSSNFGGTRSINIDISGPDLQTLFDASLKVFLKSKADGRGVLALGLPAAYHGEPARRHQRRHCGLVPAQPRRRTPR